MDLTVRYVHLGGQLELQRRSVRPFVMSSWGVTIFAPDATGVSNEVCFSFGAGLDLKAYLGQARRGGLIFGFAFLRLGLLACIVAHYVVDAVLLGIPLLTSGNPAYSVSGIVVMGLALLPAVLGLTAARGAAEATAPTPD